MTAAPPDGDRPSGREPPGHEPPGREPTHRWAPPPDRARSPYTGWTRAHWEAYADRLLDALVPYASPGFAQYRLPGRTSVSGPVSDGLEGYARSFLLAAFRIAGAGGDVDPALPERYAAGLAAGTDPARGDEAWPPITDRRQPMVEAASIAVALHETRPWLWDRLDGAVRERVADWLGGFAGAVPHDNNWRLFQVVAEQFLASVGAPHAREDIEGGLDRIEDWYLGDGWYSDGSGRHFDHYNGWAMHLYPLLWSRMAGDTDEATGGRASVYRDRLRRFLGTYPHFFGADGAPVHQGRSLVYRFAVATPAWMGALADCTPLAPGLTRRLASGAVSHFAERGVPDERGLLTLGWYGPYLPMTQDYSGPASPYWAAKGFLGLLLPPSHPVWTAAEEPLPVEEADFAVALPQPGWLLHGTRDDGLVRLVNHGSSRMPYDPATDPGRPEEPHYAKFGYSTATSPLTSPAAWERDTDGHVALLDAVGTASRRGRFEPVECGGRRAASRYEARLPGDPVAYPVETTSLLHGPYEIRVHRLTAPAGATVREGGYAVSGPEAAETATGPGWAAARCGGVTAAVAGLHGWGSADVVRDEGAAAHGPYSATPYLWLADHPGGRTVHVTLVALRGGPGVDADALRAGIRVTVAGEEVTIAFPDGTEERV